MANKNPPKQDKSNFVIIQLFMWYIYPTNWFLIAYKYTDFDGFFKHNIWFKKCKIHFQNMLFLNNHILRTAKNGTGWKFVLK